MVDRFTITAAEQDPWIDADPSGQWVRYSDYAALEAQLAETQEKLIEANDKLIRQNEALSRTGAVKVKALDEDDYEEIISAAAIKMRKATSGARGQIITVQDCLDWWVMKETESRILAAIEAAPPAPKVTEAMELARAVLAQSITAGHNVPGPTPEDIEKAFWALDAALRALKEKQG